jgi:hypothetical protein
MQSGLLQLRRENDALRREISFLRAHPKLARGLRGEKLILSIVSGVSSSRGSDYDVITKDDQVRLEIKYSSLLPMRGKDTCRWAWTKIFGESGTKRFNRLILVGEADDRFRSQYKDPSAPYIFFDVPPLAAARLTNGRKPGRKSVIHLTTNPAVIRSERASELFYRHQATVRDLELRYLRHPVVSTGNQQSSNAMDSDTEPR